MLSDHTVVEKQRRQLEELQERRDQLEMMMRWQRSLIDLDQQMVGELAVLWDELVPGFRLNENGERSLQKWCRRFDLDKIIGGMKTSVDQYLCFDGEDPTVPTKESVEKAFDYVPRIIVSEERMRERPYLRDLYYIRGILRNRFRYLNEWKALSIMEAVVLDGGTTDDIKAIALSVDDWADFCAEVEQLRESLAQKAS